MDFANLKKLRKIGYLRVSTKDQKLDRQFQGLIDICDELHVEQISGRTKARTRPVYQKVVKRLRKGDMLVVWDLDRAFRTAVDAITEAERLRKRGIEFKMITMHIDTTNAQGRYAYGMFALNAQFMAEWCVEKTLEGIAAARRNGKTLGRPRKLSSEQIKVARMRLQLNEISKKALAIELEVGRWTLDRALKRTEKSP